jgi:hypothetical protein
MGLPQLLLQAPEQRPTLHHSVGQRLKQLLVRHALACLDSMAHSFCLQELVQLNLCQPATPSAITAKHSCFGDY